jgi:hypothetical protein
MMLKKTQIQARKPRPRSFLTAAQNAHRGLHPRFRFVHLMRSAFVRDSKLQFQQAMIVLSLRHLSITRHFADEFMASSSIPDVVR